jgi:hypothetical protein
MKATLCVLLGLPVCVLLGCPQMHELEVQILSLLGPRDRGLSPDYII